MNQTIPSFVFKRRAWTAIRPWMQVLIVAGLLVVLPGLLCQVADTLLSDEMSDAIGGPAYALLDFFSQEIPEDTTEQELYAMAEEANTLSMTFLNACVGFYTGAGKILVILGAVDLLLTPVFLAPLYGALLEALRKKELNFAVCLRYLKLSLKSLLLFLWMTLRVGVWMLPGMAVMMLGVFVPVVYELLVLAGFAGSMVLGVRAMLHYILAPVVLVDQPQLSLNGCIRQSWQVMRTRKMEYFMLRISFVGWQLLISLIGSIAVNAVMTAIALTLTMMGNLLLTIYMNGAVVAFWDAYGVKKETPADAIREMLGGSAPEDDLN
ncbi:MAG: hypothetical protein IJE07_05275 [Clostridia bacterium]|nr:hypothetical protein [Clostridia bacterium]